MGGEKTGLQRKDEGWEREKGGGEKREKKVIFREPELP